MLSVFVPPIEHYMPILVLFLLASSICCAITPVKARAQSRSSAQAGQSSSRTGSGDQTAQPSNTSIPSSSGKDELITQDDEVVRVDTNLTNILFTAVDWNKRFITTLRQEDIRVLEDGTPQEIFTFQQETNRPLSLALLIDISVSQKNMLPHEKSAARTFVDTIFRTERDEVAIVSFTGDTTVEQELTANVGRVRRAIERVEIVLPPDHPDSGITLPGSAPPPPSTDPRLGTTAIWDAVWSVSEELLSETSEKRRRAIILLTDGVDTSSIMKRSEAIDQALKHDTVIYAIGIGDEENYEGVEEDTLRKLSERTGGRAYFPKDDQELRVAFRQIEHELRSQYLVAYSSTNKSLDGSYRKVQIEVVNPVLRKEKLRLTYRQGYFAKKGAATAPAPSTRQP
jgi:Ca-activated chloride channel family protein